MDIKALMDELLEHGCILQSREALAQGIIEKWSFRWSSLPVEKIDGEKEADASS